MILSMLAVGWHPVDAIDMTDEDLSWIEELAAHPKVVALEKWDLIIIGINHQRKFKKMYFRKQIR